MDFIQMNIMEFCGGEAALTSLNIDNNLTALVHKLAEHRVKEIYGDYFKGDIDKFVKYECEHYSGFGSKEFHWSFRPKEVKIQGSRDSTEFTLNRKDFTAKLKEVIGSMGVR